MKLLIIQRSKSLFFKIIIIFIYVIEILLAQIDG